MTTQPATPNVFIGMDIHKKSWSIAIRTDIGEHKTFTTTAKEEVLFDYVNTNFPDHEVSLVYEAGCCGFSASRYFLSMGWKVVVVNPADVPRMDKQSYQKTDAIDCRNLAKQLQAGTITGIHIPSEEQDLHKSLVRQKAEVSRQLRSCKNTIKAFLLYHGIVVPEKYDNPNWSKEFLSWLSNLEFTHASGKVTLDSKLRILNCLHSEHLELANQLRAYCRKNHKQDYYLLKSVPGIGGYLASAILGELGDIRRFNNETQFASYVGIIPMMRSSGGSENIFGVTPRCRGLLRSYIIEAAWVALRKDPEMQAYYRKHIGKNPKRIIVKIARKLLNRILSVIKTEYPYQINHQILSKVKTA